MAKWEVDLFGINVAILPQAIRLLFGAFPSFLKQLHIDHAFDVAR